jgi:hypothetical protein
MQPPPPDPALPMTVLGRRVSLSAVLTLGAGLVIAAAVALVSPAASLVSLLVFAVAAYNVNCAHVGRCHVFAWALTALYLLYAAVVLVAVLTGRGAYAALGRAKK